MTRLSYGRDGLAAAMVPVRRRPCRPSVRVRPRNGVAEFASVEFGDHADRGLLARRLTEPLSVISGTSAPGSRAGDRVSPDVSMMFSPAAAGRTRLRRSLYAADSIVAPLPQVGNEVEPRVAGISTPALRTLAATPLRSLAISGSPSRAGRQGNGATARGGSATGREFAPGVPEDAVQESMSIVGDGVAERLLVAVAVALEFTPAALAASIVRRPARGRPRCRRGEGASGGMPSRPRSSRRREGLGEFFGPGGHRPGEDNGSGGHEGTTCPPDVQERQGRKRGGGTRSRRDSIPSSATGSQSSMRTRGLECSVMSSFSCRRGGCGGPCGHVWRRCRCTWSTSSTSPRCSWR